MRCIPLIAHADSFFSFFLLMRCQMSKQNAPKLTWDIDAHQVSLFLKRHNIREGKIHITANGVAKFTVINDDKTKIPERYHPLIVFIDKPLTVLPTGNGVASH